MAPRSKKQNAKAKERAELQNIEEVTITIRASELNLQRLAALLMFCEHLEPKVKLAEVGPMPWEDPNDPKFVAELPELEIDYEVVRRSITKLLGQYVKQHGEDRARSVLNSFGAQRLSSVPLPQLIPLNAALEAALQQENE